MKMSSMWKSVVVAVVAGSCLAAGVALAEGGQVRQGNGNGYGATRRSGASTPTTVQQRDQCRGRARDGSCQATATGQRDQARDRARDGSCKSR